MQLKKHTLEKTYIQLIKAISKKKRAKLIT